MLHDLTRRVYRSAAFRLHRLAAQFERRGRELDLRRLGLSGEIKTWTSRDELAALHRLASEVPYGGNILEVGSYLGASTCYLAAGAQEREAHLVCVDTWQNETIPEGERDTLPEFERNIAGAASMITIVRKRSADLVPSDLRLPVHFAFLDADHSYESTKSDAAAVLPLMAPNGIVAFHDSANFRGVARALGEIFCAGEWCLAGHVDNMSWIRRATWAPTA